ncbi:hypothetical protein GGR39_002027 [Novosphingobium fluoreni]|uniref:Uncharacterized protein n=1 Tax=Novosphingobium fluoreni TaxID=1391222 RepID=A0A7W6C1F5_9SPHN|nr:hypothetical protein [Novosphingobium fluoreni]
MEVSIVLRLFVERMPDIELAGPDGRSLGYG